MPDLTLSSPAFDDGERIPEKYGYERANVHPPLVIAGVPDGTKSLALVMDDPDARSVAGKVWDHWVLWNLPAETEQLEEGELPAVAREGRNDFGSVGYGGPNPPDREHTYVLTLYALDTELDLQQGATVDDLEQAVEDHVIAEARLEGTYAP